jgi:ADP-ribose pyrophosphatase YjhB (NUDIX family)
LELGAVNAVGVLFYCVTTSRHLYLMRADKKYKQTWGLPGGKIEAGESLLAAIERECTEELGGMPDYINLIPIEKFTTKDDVFCYHTFICCVEKEWLPTLNNEHIGYAWVDNNIVPKPLHPGLWNTINFDTIKDKITIITDGFSQYRKD